MTCTDRLRKHTHCVEITPYEHTHAHIPAHNRTYRRAANAVFVAHDDLFWI